MSFHYPDDISVQNNCNKRNVSIMCENVFIIKLITFAGKKSSFKNNCDGKLSWTFMSNQLGHCLSKTRAARSSVLYIKIS